MLSSLLLVTRDYLHMNMGCAANFLQGMRKKKRSCAEYGSAYTLEAPSEAVVAELQFPTLGLLLSCFFSASVLVFSSGWNFQCSVTDFTLLFQWSFKPLVGPHKDVNSFTCVWSMVFSHRCCYYLCLQFGPPVLLPCLEFQQIQDCCLLQLGPRGHIWGVPST